MVSNEPLLSFLDESLRYRVILHTFQPEPAMRTGPQTCRAACANVKTAALPSEVDLGRSADFSALLLYLHGQHAGKLLVDLLDLNRPTNTLTLGKYALHFLLVPERVDLAITSFGILDFEFVHARK